MILRQVTAVMARERRGQLHLMQLGKPGRNACIETSTDACVRSASVSTGFRCGGNAEPRLEMAAENRARAEDGSARNTQVVPAKQPAPRTATMAPALENLAANRRGLGERDDEG